MVRAAERVRLVGAVSAGKISGVASRLAGRGGGTALPGLVARGIQPDIVRSLVGQLRGGSIVVSGTNGKTTTSRMLGAILGDAGMTPVRNESGSNLMRGLASTLVQRASPWGSLPRAAVGLFEVDEAALPEVVAEVNPAALLLLNLFRDQLDRYGEVAAIARIWAVALRGLPESAEIVANADDPLVTEVASHATSSPLFYGIRSTRLPESPEHASDVKACPRCGASVEYSHTFLGHLGHYACRNRDLLRPEPKVMAVDVQLHGLGGSEFLLVAPGGEAWVRVPLPGLYNVYNALAAAALATSLGVQPTAVAASLARVQPAFGRMERLEIEGRIVYLALAKNPAGLNQVLRTVTDDVNGVHLFMMLNDNIADGRDVSWIWDADVELLRDRVQSVVFGGVRAEDMALRFKYAGVLDGAASWSIEHGTPAAFRQALKHAPPGATLFVIPTYTAMLDVRNALSQMGYVRPYWEE